MHVAVRVSEFVRRDLPGYVGQIVLWFTAAFIGSLGGLPQQMGIGPAALVAAITGGWAISAAAWPFTALVLLVGSYAQVSLPGSGWFGTAPMR